MEIEMSLRKNAGVEIQYLGQCWCGVTSTIQACTCLLVKCMYKIAAILAQLFCAIQIIL